MITSLVFAAVWFLLIVLGLTYLFRKARLRKEKGLLLRDIIMIRIGDSGIISLRKMIVSDQWYYGIKADKVPTLYKLSAKEILEGEKRNVSAT